MATLRAKRKKSALDDLLVELSRFTDLEGSTSRFQSQSLRELYQFEPGSLDDDLLSLRKDRQMLQMDWEQAVRKFLEEMARER